MTFLANKKEKKKLITNCVINKVMSTVLSNQSMYILSLIFIATCEKTKVQTECIAPHFELAFQIAVPFTTSCLTKL